MHKTQDFILITFGSAAFPDLFTIYFSLFTKKAPLFQAMLFD